MKNTDTTTDTTTATTPPRWTPATSLDDLSRGCHVMIATPLGLQGAIVIDARDTLTNWYRGESGEPMVCISFDEPEDQRHMVEWRPLTSVHVALSNMRHVLAPVRSNTLTEPVIQSEPIQSDYLDRHPEMLEGIEFLYV